MRKFLLLLMAIAGITSCQKEIENLKDRGANNNNPLKGNWDFAAAHVESQNSSEINVLGEDDKTVSFNNYNTKNNSGTCVIDDTAFHFTGLSYIISSSIPSYIYQNGILTDSLIVPFDYTQPSTDYIAPYTLIDPDSIYFPKGTIPLADPSQQQQAVGGRYTFKSRSIKITLSINIDTTVINSGMTEHIISSGITVLNLTK